MFKQKTYKRKLYRKLGTNLGYEMSSKSINEGKGLSPFSRLVYFALTQGHMLINSKISNASYSDIQAFTGISSRSTISRCLEELKTNRFIVKSTEKGKEGKYILLKAIFFGQEEREYEPKKEIKNTRYKKNFIKTTSPSIGLVSISPIYNNSSSLVNSSVITKKQKQKEYVSVFFKNGDIIQLKSSSRFSILSNKALMEFHFKFGKNFLQEKIELLELTYDGSFAKISINKSVDSLLACACYQNYQPTDRQANALENYRKQKLYELHGEQLFRKEDALAMESLRETNIKFIQSDSNYTPKYSFNELFGGGFKNKKSTDPLKLDDWVLAMVRDKDGFDYDGLLAYGEDFESDKSYLFTKDQLVVSAFKKIYPHYVNSYFSGN